ncbi:hypothetical protein ILUMI_07540 [Ignelater luminosus]|uniref:ZAD domain-containing protein n=1 Tax=Ignelater luminosus TaxID=2038154 RepID=A0A8K0DD96_IGNLU|nr:hypothetical protein ILUMI_07540 [Ignelater luminosus]
MNEICRTCLQEVGDSSVMFYLDAVDSHSETITIRCKLADCVPEMDLDVVPNAFICNSCFESLMVAHEFKNKCLETEGRIQSYIEQMGYVLTSVDLREIVQQSKVQLPTVNIKSQIATTTFMQPLNYPTAKDSSHSRTTLFDSNKNPVKLKDEPKEKSLDLKNLQCDTRAFFAVPKIAQLLAEGDRNLYKCGQCNYKASSDFELKSHEETHQSQRLEKCDFFAVPRITQLLTEGNGTSSHICHQCSYIASSDLDLKSHEETHRVCDTKNFFCHTKNFTVFK